MSTVPPYPESADEQAKWEKLYAGAQQAPLPEPRETVAWEHDMGHRNVLSYSNDKEGSFGTRELVYKIESDQGHLTERSQVDRCAHTDFRASVGVGRLTDEGGAVTGYTADIRINCSHCHVPMQFLGLEPGSDSQGARCSIDGLEARIALCVDGQRPSPLQRIAFNIERFDA